MSAYILHLNDNNWLELTDVEGFVKFKLRGHRNGGHGAADVYIILKYIIEENTIIFNDGEGEEPDEFFHIDGNMNQNENLQFNISNAFVYYVGKGSITDTFSKLLLEPAPIQKWDYFALSFYDEYNTFSKKPEEAIREIIIVVNFDGSVMGGRRKSLFRKSLFRKSLIRKSLFRKKRTKKRTKRRTKNKTKNKTKRRVKGKGG